MNENPEGAAAPLTPAPEAAAPEAAAPVATDAAPAVAVPKKKKTGIIIGSIIGALILGASRVAASEFTFVLAIPAMLGASLFEFKDFLEEMYQRYQL